MRRRLISCLVVFSCAVWVCTAGTSWATVVPFDTTINMTLTPGGGINNQLNMSVSYSVASGSGSTTASGSYSVELIGSVDTSTNVATVTGLDFIKQSGPGNITCSDFSIDMTVWPGIHAETVSFSGLRGDLDGQGTPVSVSSGSFPLTSTLFWMNGGTVSASGLTGYSQDFGASPASGLLTGSGSIATSQTSVSGGGADIRAGKIVFDYVSGGDPAATIEGLLAASYHGGLWNTGQFHSSTSSASCGLAWTDDTVNDKVTVAYALYGDANLDGAVNGADLNIVLSNYNQAGATWSKGDFNYDGAVNGADLNIVLSDYNQTLSVQAGAAVPEPSTLVLAAAGLAGLLAYAWRKRK